jgi:transcription elongation factor Elf1
MMAKEPSKISELKAVRTNVETTDAIRLELALQRKRCRYCGQSGSAWTVYKTEGETRYLKCRGCGRNDKVIVPRLAGAVEAGMEEGDGKETEAPPAE